MTAGLSTKRGPGDEEELESGHRHNNRQRQNSQPANEVEYAAASAVDRPKERTGAGNASLATECEVIRAIVLEGSLQMMHGL